MKGLKRDNNKQKRPAIYIFTAYGVFFMARQKKLKQVNLTTCYHRVAKS